MSGAAGLRATADVPAQMAAGPRPAGYRRDVDGLRAIAIVPVVLFHTGLAAFQGGFVGVDVFFVISGFLITGLIAREIRDGRFSVARFYVRRARRILPALIVVLCATMALGAVLLAPGELRDLGKSVVAAALSFSNVLFQRQVDYFANLDVKPLLMTWSLGVEEQFYLGWPLALVLAHRCRLPQWSALVALAAISFAYALWAVPHAPVAAFYLIPARAWELLLGGALAVGALDAAGGRVGPAGRSALSVMGLGLILAAVVLYRHETPFPGLSALAPCLGAALLIFAGEGALVNRRVLASRPLVFIGLISYSLYLWHWPLLSYVRTLHLGELPPAWAASAVLAAVALSVATWRLVERPFRRPSDRGSGAVLLRFGAATALVAALGWSLVRAHGLPQRVSARVIAAERARDDHGELFEACHEAASTDVVPNPACVVGADGGKPLLVLWGDSQADAIAPAFRRAAGQAGMGFVQLSRDACPPLPDVRVFEDAAPLDGCGEINRRVLSYVVGEPRVAVVAIAGRWPLYTETTRFGRERGKRMYLTDGASAERSPASSRRVFAAALAGITGRLRAAGKRVVLVGPVPEVGVDVPDCHVRAHMPFGWAQACEVPARDAEARMGFATAAIEGLAAGEGVTAFLPARRLCGAERCASEVGGALLYSDDDHLSRTGALYVGEELRIAATR